jgi:4-hydroxybenzoate polyprenyltransferase
MTADHQKPEAETEPLKTIADTVADAPKGNWVDTLAPAATRPFLRLSRADRPIGTWLLLIPCFWGLALAAAADPAGYRVWDVWIACGCVLGAYLMRGAGCTWNDITDRKFDAAVARTKSRPIPSRQVTVRQALIWMSLQVILAGMILLTFNKVAIALGIASLGLVVIYPFAKRFTWWPQVFLGLAFNWGALVAWAAHSGSLSAAALLLWMSGIAWTLFYDTIYAHQDKEDDALIGVKSTARLFGDAGSRPWMRGFLVAAVLLMTAAVLMAFVPAEAGLTKILIALLGVWGFGAHMALQLIRLDTTNPEKCLILFRTNRDAGLIPALFFAGAALL